MTIRSACGRAKSSEMDRASSATASRRPVDSSVSAPPGPSLHWRRSAIRGQREMAHSQSATCPVPERRLIACASSCAPVDMTGPGSAVSRCASLIARPATSRRSKSPYAHHQSRTQSDANASGTPAARSSCTAVRPRHTGVRGPSAGNASSLKGGPVPLRSPRARLVNGLTTTVTPCGRPRASVPRRLMMLRRRLSSSSCARPRRGAVGEENMTSIAPGACSRERVAECPEGERIGVPAVVLVDVEVHIQLMRWQHGCPLPCASSSSSHSQLLPAADRGTTRRGRRQTRTRVEASHGRVWISRAAEEPIEPARQVCCGNWLVRAESTQCNGDPTCDACCSTRAR
mmetsp:Transcript_2627/g.7525  ORF Transcript_2627/g.7525 Transcript_2627/m.7525 type:complete len:344 (-) Transcript_2627:98-1129(-)